MQRVVDQNLSQDLCKPAEKLQQTFDLCACQVFSTKSDCSMDQILILCENMIINIIKFVQCCYSGFFCDISSLNVKMYL